MFQLSLVFYLHKHVSNFLSKSLDHGGQKVCGCVPVAILDLLMHNFIIGHLKNNASLTYANVVNVDTFHYKMQRSHY
jgi:hypothetical protein